MLSIIIRISCFFAILLIGCSQNEKSSPPMIGNIKDTSSTITKVAMLRKKGELFDSCQFPYSGNCLYMLCASSDLISESDSSQKNTSSPILVTYRRKPEIITDEKTKTAYLKESDPFLIYSNVIFKENSDTITFDDFISKDVTAAIDRGEVVSKREEIMTSESIKSIVYQFNLKADQYIAVSYIDISKYIVMIIYTANGLKAFIESYWYFSDIVKSFKYYGD